MLGEGGDPAKSGVRPRGPVGRRLPGPHPAELGSRRRCCSWWSPRWCGGDAGDRPAYGPIPRSGNARRRVTARARDPARHRPHLGGVHRPRRLGAAVPLRPDLADVELDVHLRQRLPGHLRRPARRRLLHPRRPLHRRRRRQAGQEGRQGARRGRVAAAPGLDQARRLDREGGRRPQDQGGRRRVHLPQPARASLQGPAARCTSTPSSRARSRTRSSRTSAGSCRSAAPTARSSCPTARAGRRSASPSTTAAAGGRAATTSTGTAPATPRRTSAASRSSAATGASSSS